MQNDNKQPKIVWLRLSAYAIKIVKSGAFHLQGPGGDVISKDPLQVSVTFKIGRAHDKKIAYSASLSMQIVMSLFSTSW